MYFFSICVFNTRVSCNKWLILDYNRAYTYVGKTIFSLNELIFILLNVQEIETFHPT